MITPAWLTLTGLVVAAAGGWYLLRAQRRSLDAHSQAAQETALGSLLEKGAGQLIADLRTDLNRLREDLSAARVSEDRLEARVADLESMLAAAEANLRRAQTRITLLESFLRDKGFDPAVLMGGG